MRKCFVLISLMNAVNLSCFDSPGGSSGLRPSSGRHSISVSTNSQCSAQRTDPRYGRGASNQLGGDVSTAADGSAESISTKIHHRLRQTSLPSLPGTYYMLIVCFLHCQHCCGDITIEPRLYTFNRPRTEVDV